MPRMAPIQGRNTTCLILTLIIAAVLLFLGVGALAYFPNNLLFFSHRPTPTTHNSSQKPVIITPQGKEALGISEGAYAFDTTRSDGDLKQQGSQKFKAGDKTAAESLWQQAVQKDPSDAEAHIYLENLKVSSEGNNYISLVIGTMLTGDDSALGSSRSTLQGAYIAQKEYNDGSKLSNNTKVRLLIANSGSTTDGVKPVANEIVQLAKQDKTIVGVMGWIYSSRTEAALAILAQAHISMVSSTASADDLSGRSFFFRVVPPNKDQALRGATYARNDLQAHKVALFVDVNDPYSSNLADDFSNDFATDANHQIKRTIYTVSHSDTLPSLLQTALQDNPDLIYFSGYSSDLATILINLPSSFPNLQIMGGDALYTLQGYPTTARQNFNRLRFTSFFYPDQWNIENMSSEAPLFFSSYISNFSPTFNPQTDHPVYGSSRPDSNAALSYDATLVLLKGCTQVLSQTQTVVTPDALQASIARIAGTNALQGASGTISFDSDGDPVNKIVMILRVSPEGYIQLAQNTDIYGCLQIGQTNCL